MRMTITTSLRILVSSNYDEAVTAVECDHKTRLVKLTRSIFSIALVTFNTGEFFTSLRYLMNIVLFLDLRLSGVPRSPHHLLELYII